LELKTPQMAVNQVIYKKKVLIYVFLMLMCFPMAIWGQYDDTIKGKITVNYNNPNRMKVSVLASTAMEIQSIGGGVFLPTASIDAHMRPSRWVTLHGGFTQQFQLGWQYQKIRDTRNIEFGGRVFFSQKVIDKTKTFTAGTKFWTYDFLFPVKVLWNTGISGSFRYGTGVFNTGTDANTAVKFTNIETNKVQFLEQAAIPYTFSELTAGFVVSTSSNMKVTAHIPASRITRERRMKTYTEFRVEGIYGRAFNFDTLISRKYNDQATEYTDYRVDILRTENWGIRFQGIFRRKLLGLKLEAGTRPGIYYRFSESERGSILDRSYILLGFGFGWM
jgi:hypothetical protein